MAFEAYLKTNKHVNTGGLLGVCLGWGFYYCEEISWAQQLLKEKYWVAYISEG